MSKPFRDEDDAFARLLREGAISTLETQLLRAAAELPKTEPVRDLAMGLTLDDLTVTGWDVMCVNAAVLSRKEPITAIGIDLTIHSGGRDSEGLCIQCLETSYYSDQSGFAFSRAIRDEVRAACVEITPIWAGSFVDLDYAVGIEGVNALYDAIETLDATRRMDVAAQRTLFVGSWIRHLRVHQALARELAREGLSRTIPLIVGSHDLEPAVTSVYRSDRDRDDESAADEVIAAAVAREREDQNKITSKIIADWRERRIKVRNWPTNGRILERKEYLEFAKSYEKLQRIDLSDLADLPYSFEGTDAQFEYLIALYRHLRHPEERRPRPPRWKWAHRLLGR